MRKGSDNTDRSSERDISITFSTWSKEMFSTLVGVCFFLPAKLQYSSDSYLKNKKFKLHRNLQRQSRSAKSVDHKKNARCSQALSLLKPNDNPLWNANWNLFAYQNKAFFLSLFPFRDSGMCRLVTLLHECWPLFLWN